MDYVLPPSLIANQADWTLIDYSGMQQSPLSGAVRTISRGQRWQAHLQWHDLIGDDRAALSSIMAVIRGKSNRLWIADPSYRQRGSFPSTELLSNPLFAGTTGWSVTGAGAILGYNRTLSLNTTASAPAPGVFQGVSVVNGAAYALRSCIVDTPATVGLTIGVQLANPGNVFPATGRGLVTSAAMALAGGSASQFPLIISSGTLSAGMQVLCTYASMRRCALAINPGATTYYSSIPVDALPPSTAGLLRAGDRVEINGEFKTVTFDLNSDAGGLGLLLFEPALRKLVPDNAPVIIGEPMMRGILAADAVQISRPGLFSDFDLTFVEG